jgi:hypothetical protein
MNLMSGHSRALPLLAGGWFVKPLRRFFLAALAAAIVSGCGRGDPRLAVSGTVRFKGQLLDQGRIEFHPPENKGTMSGAVIQNGRYDIPRDKGLAPATYEVRIYSYDEKGAKEGVPAEAGLGFKERISKKYNAASTLKADVKPGNTTFDFSVD